MSRTRNIVFGIIAGVACLILLSVLRHFIFGGFGAGLNTFLQIAVLLVSLVVGVRIYRYNQDRDEMESEGAEAE